MTNPDTPVPSLPVTGPEHAYLSTSCFHGNHGYCGSPVGSNGETTWSKVGASCKFCGAQCQCPCGHPGVDAATEPVPSAEQAQLAVMKPALQRLAADEWMTSPGDGPVDWFALTAEMTARSEYAAGALEAAGIAANLSLERKVTPVFPEPCDGGCASRLGTGPCDCGPVARHEALVAAAQHAPRPDWDSASARADKARDALLRAALGCLSADMEAEAEPGIDADSRCDDADDLLAVAAAELAQATRLLAAIRAGQPDPWAPDHDGAPF